MSYVKKVNRNLLVWYYTIKEMCFIYSVCEILNSHGIMPMFINGFNFNNCPRYNKKCPSHIHPHKRTFYPIKWDIQYTVSYFRALSTCLNIFYVYIFGTADSFTFNRPRPFVRSPCRFAY